MLVLPAFYDGNTVRTIDNYTFSKNQKLMITVLDDDEKVEPKHAQQKKSIDRFFETANALNLTSNGQKWTREELYER